ncbi:MAG: hypothetical protein LH654_11855 [Thermoleophilia bacterium]|nr:hypothetical protein [Thermoleophilia bacterium]
MRRPALLPVLLAVAVECELILSDALHAGLWPISVAAGFTVLLLAARGRWPLAALLALLAAPAIDALLGGVLVGDLITPLLAVVVAVFALGSRVSGWALAAGAVAAVGILTAANQVDPDTDYSVINDVVFYSVMAVGAPLLASRLLADLQRIAGALRERAARAAASSERVADAARLEERARLAGELRDAIAQRIGEIALQASGAHRVASRDLDGLSPLWRRSRRPHARYL